mmetsp:Transcript_37407/g.60815  ORF Transcript_37407/g.60815 Transcript_37407/m.60815 type:complete len:94 (-) Transcript_37407:15-296(-)
MQSLDATATTSRSLVQKQTQCRFKKKNVSSLRGRPSCILAICAVSSHQDARLQKFVGAHSLPVKANVCASKTCSLGCMLRKSTMNCLLLAGLR